MREVKFRVFDKNIPRNLEEADKDTPSGEMVEWDYVKRSSYFPQALQGEYPLMQYTGLKDKNGVEIYEGDILTDHGEEGPLYIEYSKQNAAFCFIDKFDRWGTVIYRPTDISYEQFEVIGNIYEHSHLLEGEK